MADHIGRVLSDRYRIVAPIGAGASAQVFLADDTRLRRRVAVKLLHAALADDEGFLRRFRAEAQAAAALNHPNIVAVYDWGEDAGTPYLISEYLGGGSLRGVLDTGHLLTPSQALLVGLEAARALDHAHRRGFVHRDIKPANLLFGEEGRLRVADFGLARALAEAAWTEPTGAMYGTARYASPEQARGKSVDGRADVYSLALVLVEAVTGKVPFASDTTIATLMARTEDDVPVPEALGPLRKALARAGALDPEDRPDAGELEIALMAAAEELTRPEPLPLVAPVGPAAVADDRDLTLVSSSNVVPLRPAEEPAADAPAPGLVTVEDLEPGPELDAYVEESRRQRKRRQKAERRAERGPRRWPRVLGTLVVLAALAVGGVLAWQALAVPTHIVPDFEGDQRQVAIDLIEENGWELAPITTARRDGTEAGEVIDQDPPPGTELAEGETVTLVVSDGPELHDVPTDLRGMTVEQATAAITGQNLTVVEETIAAFDDEIEAGLVLGVADGTAARLLSGEPVQLVVSRGQRLVPAVPDAATFDDYCALLPEVELVCSGPTEVDSDTVPAGRIVSISPSAGTRMDQGAAVEVTVSLGPAPLPDVSGQSVLEASQTLTNAGYRVVGVQGPPIFPVASTDPAAGSRVPKGTEVTLITRSG